MGKYIVTYDLCKPQQNYAELINRLKLYSACRVTESCWLIVTSQTAVEIRDNLGYYIDSNDRIMVAALTGEAAWKNLITSGSAIKDLLTF